MMPRGIKTLRKSDNREVAFQQTKNVKINLIKLCVYGMKNDEFCVYVRVSRRRRWGVNGHNHVTECEK